MLPSKRVETLLSMYLEQAENGVEELAAQANKLDLNANDVPSLQTSDKELDINGNLPSTDLAKPAKLITSLQATAHRPEIFAEQLNPSRGCNAQQGVGYPYRKQRSDPGYAQERRRYDAPSNVSAPANQRQDALLRQKSESAILSGAVPHHASDRRYNTHQQKQLIKQMHGYNPNIVSMKSQPRRSFSAMSYNNYNYQGERPVYGRQAHNIAAAGHLRDIQSGPAAYGQQSLSAPPLATWSHSLKSPTHRSITQYSHDDFEPFISPSISSDDVYGYPQPTSSTAENGFGLQQVSLIRDPGTLSQLDEDGGSDEDPDNSHPNKFSIAIEEHTNTECGYKRQPVRSGQQVKVVRKGSDVYNATSPTGSAEISQDQIRKYYRKDLVRVCLCGKYDTKESLLANRGRDNDADGYEVHYNVKCRWKSYEDYKTKQRVIIRLCKCYKPSF